MQDPYLMQISKGQAPIKKQIKFFTLFTFLRLLTKAWWWEPHFRRFKVDLCTKNCKLVHTECKSTEPTELILSKQEKPLMATDAPSNTKPSLSPFRQKRTTTPLPNPSLKQPTPSKISKAFALPKRFSLFPLYQQNSKRPEIQPQTFICWENPALTPQTINQNQFRYKKRSVSAPSGPDHPPHKP